MVRVPGPGRFELRLPDGAVNPYLLQAVILAAGLSGLKSKADPGPRHDIDMYAEGHKVKDAPKLPTIDAPVVLLEVEIAILTGAPVLAALLDSLPTGRQARERRALHEGLHG